MTRGPSALRALAGIVAAVLLVAPASPSGNGRKFYADDPLQREPETQNASGVEAWEIDLIFDLAENLFTRPGDPAAGRARAQHQHDRRGARLELVHQPHPRAPGVDRKRPCAVRSPARARRRAPGRSSRPKEAGAAPGLHDARCQGRSLVRLVRREGIPRSGHRRDSRREQDLLDARLLAGGELSRRRCGWISSPSRSRRRSRRPPARNARCGSPTSKRCCAERIRAPTAPTAPSRRAPSPASRSAGSATTARGPTIRTTSSRTSTGASCAR